MFMLSSYQFLVGGDEGRDRCHGQILVSAGCGSSKIDHPKWNGLQATEEGFKIILIKE